MTVLLAGDRPDGLALLRFRPSVWTEQQEAYLQELYVVPELRGNGIGEALMQAVLATCRAHNAAWIELNTGETDVAAREPLSQARLHQRRRPGRRLDALLRAPALSRLFPFLLPIRK